MHTMKAVRIHTYGGPEVLVYEEVPRPQPGQGEVLVRVEAAAVNPVDWKIREGYLREMLPHALPLIMGWDVSGVVEETGPGVTRFRAGDEVFSRPDLLRDGTYAEYVVIRETEVALKPGSVDHLHAAAIPLAGLTAWKSLIEAAGAAPGQRVLIHGAAGGVGSYAVQLAKWRGAHVTATASAPNLDYLRRLGADEIIDYRSVRFEDVTGDVDVVIDTIGGDTQQRSWQVLKRGGSSSPSSHPRHRSRLPPMASARRSSSSSPMQRCWRSWQSWSMQGSSGLTWKRCCRLPRRAVRRS